MKYLLIFSLFFSTTVIAAEPSWRTDAWKVLEIAQAFLDNELSKEQFRESVLSLKQSMGEENKQVPVCTPVYIEVPVYTEAPVRTTLDITPGFNCNSAETSTEKAICGNQQLRLYDLRMSFLYFEGIAKGKMTEEQLSWQKRRNSCGADVKCLSNKYRERISQLE